MGVWDWDLATDVVSGDARLRALWGLGPGEIRAADLLARIHPDDRPGVERVLGAAIEGRAPYSVEFRVAGPDGAVRWLAGPGRVAVGTDGAPTAIVGVNFDVTARKQSEEALRASAGRATFRAALADVVRSVGDPADVQAAVARALGEHLGATRVHYAEVEPDGAHAVVADDYTDGAASVRGRHTLDDFGSALIERYRAGHRLVVADVAIEPSLTGPEREAYAAIQVGALVGVPLVKEGRFAALLVVHQAEPRAWTAEEVALVEETAERTWTAIERARAEVALRESEERYRTLFTTIDEGYALCEVVVDGDGRAVDYRFLEVNPTFAEMTGITAEAAGRTARELVPGLEDHWVETYARAGLGREAFRFEQESPAMGRWFDVYVAPVGEPEDRRFAVVFTDVTGRRRAEQEVRDLNAALEGRVAERTAEVRRLAARLTVAEQGERERIAHVLHDDLQQQLYGLSMTLALLRRSPPGEAAEALADRADGVLQEATRMTRALSTDLSPAVLRGDGLADLLAWVAREERERYGLEVTTDARGLPPVADRAVRVLLYQVLREVLFNVVKHSGGAQARLVGWADGETVGVRVEDDGAGFDPGAVRSGSAGGFGLFSVRERLGLVGGRFEIESAPGQGTRVTLEVPSGEARPAPERLEGPLSP
ncbi:MAG TPA: PAS domain S-box protein, partial [Rubricoccaceae bacterium]